MKERKVTPEELERKYSELGDKRAKERHLAPFVLIAHVCYRNSSGDTIRSTELPVGRCFSLVEAKRLKDRIKHTIRLKQVGFNGNEIAYEEEFGPAPKLRSYNPITGEEITEHITKFETLSKEEYLKRYSI